MTIDKEKYQKKFQQQLDNYSGRFMSNSKWTKLFKKLSQNSELVNKCLVKGIWDDNLSEIQIPNIDNYSETFNDIGIRDVFISGPYQFKEIEQLVFPKVWTIGRKMRTQVLEPFKTEQDIKQIMYIINKLGKFETKIDDEKLILYAYK